ncbi:SLC13 family permease [Devosia sp. 1566]|uniref:SLC13 family permease n=1 Tax=Devosia sp. 1566 TaxID=2499144 RepID=UPI000FD775A0|nr:SLC13 family permease [Devosia sp. 1566]
MDLTILIFLLVYLAMALGGLPGLKVDRTGAAIIGALAMMTAGSIDPKDAWDSIDYSSIGMLFGLMVVSAAFVVSGFYGWTARKVAGASVSPGALLAILIVVGGLLAAFLTNDVVAVAMTPLLMSITLNRKLNPIPFLLGFCFAANAGASGTIIGSPQNMIAAQKLDLSFAGVSEITAVPALLSLPIIWIVVSWLYRGRWQLTPSADKKRPVDELASTPFSVGETAKAVLVALAVVIAFIFSPWPRELIALTAAGLLLLSRRVSSRDMLKEVDGDLLLLIMGLFVVNAAVSATGLPQRLLAQLAHGGIDLDQPFTLFWVSSIVSNIVGNNPAVMMLVPYLHSEGNAQYGAALSLGTHFSSNLVVFGSLAGIIMVERAKDYGFTISFAEFSKAGAIVTVLTMAMAAAWLLIV